MCMTILNVCKYYKILNRRICQEITILILSNAAKTMPLDQVHRWNENTKFNRGYRPAMFERSHFRLSSLRKQANITAFAISIHSFYIKYAKYTLKHWSPCLGD